MILSVELAIEIYDILVQYAGANIIEKDSFVDSHTNHRPYGECTEWRFCGNLGFGGKYRSNTNTVDCYTEDLNTERQKVIDTTNNTLQELAKKYIVCDHIKFIPFNENYTHNFSNYECSMADFGYCSHINAMIEKRYFDCLD